MAKSRETWAGIKPVFMLVEPKQPTAQESEQPIVAKKPGNPSGAGGRGAGRWRRYDRTNGKKKKKKNKPEAVPERATRDGEILLRWGWVEPRGLDRADVDGFLETGVKGGRWGSAVDRQGIYPDANSGRGVSPSRGQQGVCRVVDHVTVDGFNAPPGRAPGETQRRSTCSGDYQPQADPPQLHPQTGDAGEATVLGIPTVRETEWFKQHCRWYWNPSSERDFAVNTATAFANAPDGDAKTGCVEWSSCSRSWIHTHRRR